MAPNGEFDGAGTGVPAQDRRPRRAKKRMGWGKRILIGVGALLGLAVTVGIVLVVTKPWAPEIQVTDPGEAGRRVTDDGMLANYYPASEPGRHPAVLVIGGSEGGLNSSTDRVARALNYEGFSALALSYWGADGQPDAMENLPLETFAKALDWLRQQPEVDSANLGMIGASKGGEAAVLMASRTPELKAVVGYVPSNVVWAGINMREPWKQMSIGSTWSSGGEPLPHLPYSNDFRGGPLVELYGKSLTAVGQHPEAVIPVENSQAPLLLVCGEADTMWPACEMSRAVAERASQNDGPEVTVLAYPDAGHIVVGPPLETPGSFDLTFMGGTQEGGERALEDGWPKVVAFLEENLT